MISRLKRCSLLVAAIGAAALLGCSDSSERKPVAGSTSSGTSRFGLKVQVTEKGRRSFVRIGPADLAPSPPAEASRFVRGAGSEHAPGVVRAKDKGSALKQSNSPGVRPLADVGTPDGPLESQSQDADLGWASGTTLLVWAATSCVNDVPTADADAYHTRQLYGPDSTGYFIFSSPPDSCDRGLFYQEILLCAANRLAQVADSVGTVTWKSVQPSNMGTPSSNVPITVTIPPQATEDRFIARDVAISALAHLARTQLIAPGASPSGADVTCTDGYADEANGEFTTKVTVHPPYTTKLVHFQPLKDNWTNLSTDELKKLGAARLSQQAAISEAAVGLLQELVERNFQDDLAGAERQKANAADPAGGVAAFWGAPGVDGNANPYNTMRHAVRGLFGRLELGTGTSWSPQSYVDIDPKCVRDPDNFGRVIAGNDSTVLSYLARGRFRALEAIDSLGGGFENRFQDVPPTTLAQARAVSLLEREGVLLPRFFEDQVPRTIDGEGGAGGEGESFDYRGVITAQLLRNAAKSEGIDDTDADARTKFLSGTTADAIRSVMTAENLSEGDLRFAMDRVYGQFLLAARSFNYSPNALGDRTYAQLVAHHFGLSLLPAADTPELATLGGAVLQGGLSRRALQGDVIALMAGAQIAADCGYDADTVTSAPADFIRHSAGQVAAFQDAFSLMDVLRRHLAVVRDHAEAGDLASLVRHADAAVAQVTDWAGARVTHYVRNGEYRLLLTNATPELLGLASMDELSARIRLVSTLNTANLESSVFADCAAGRRPTAFCPAPTSYASYAPSSPTPVSGGTFGYNTDAIEVTFDDAPASFEGFLVTLPYGAAPGQVLGFIPRSYYKPPQEGAPHWLAHPLERTDDRFSRASSIIISPQRRRMTEQLFGLRPLDKAQRTCASFASTALPGDYCIEGMQRDMFVPLANELTSEGGEFEDSWKHYLRVAEDAAAKADELGRQLIELGLQNDERQEGAIEAVGELCGAYPRVSDVETTNGEIQLPPDDETIAECVAEDTIDVVFFGDDPYERFTGPNADAAATTEIRATFCDPLSPPAGFKKAAFCSKTGNLSHAGLGFHTPIVPPTKDTACGLFDTFDLAQEGAPLDKTRFSSVVLSPWAHPSGLATTLAGAHLRQFDDGEWTLTLRTRPLLASSRDAVSREAFGKQAAALNAEEVQALDAMKSSVWPWCKQGTAECTGLAARMDTVWGASGTDASLAGLLRRVERTLFTLGGLTGKIPAGAFTMYLPAIDRPGPSTGSVGFNGPVALPTLYGGGHFKVGAAGSQLTSEGMPKALQGAETAAVGTAIGVNQGYVAARSAGGRALPTWLSTTYDQMKTGNPAAGSFLLVEAQSADINFGGGSAPLVYSPEFSLARWLSEVAEAYTGACTAGTASSKLNTKLSFDAGKRYLSPDEPEANAGAVRHVCVKSAPLSPVFVSSAGAGVAANLQLLTTTTLGLTSEANQATSRVILSPLEIGGRPEAAATCAANMLNAACRNFQWLRTGGATGTYTNCPADMSGWATVASGECESFNRTVGEDFPQSATRWVQPRVRPSACPPSERVELFLDHGAENDCQALQDIVRSMAFSCATQEIDSLPPGAGPPVVKGIPDLLALEEWISRVSATTQLIIEGTVLVNIPAAAVRAARNDAPDLGNVAKGTRGQLLLELGKDLNNLEQGMANITSQFRRMQGAVAKVRVDLESADLAANGEDLSLALSKLENDRKLWQAEAAQARVYVDAAQDALAAGMMAGPAFPLVAGVKLYSGIWDAANVDADLSRDIFFLSQEGDILNDIQSNNGQEHDNRVRAAVQALNDTEKEILAGLEGDFTQLQNGRSDALIKLNALRGNQSKARLALAKATLADSVQVGDETIPLPVNTVRRRQFGVLQDRYKRALEGAKRAAYLARLSIEERLGTRMSDLHEAIGPIEAPSLWVDDLCSVQGIDYEALRSTEVPGAGGSSQTGATSNGPELDLIKGFADQYVGDYVSRLREFVEYYNLEFPFREGSDSAVISLREDLGHLQDSCIRESANLLVYSDQLTATPSEIQSVKDGWWTTGCTTGECLSVQAGTGLTNSSGDTLLPPGGAGAANWLTAIANTDAVVPAEPEAARPESVFQMVTLRAGKRYVLSWWALARSSTGGPLLSGVPAQYSVSISDSAWRPVVSELLRPAIGEQWGDRNEISFVVPSEGEYSVAFGVGLSGGAGASLAIANVQLEEAQSESSGASAYEATALSRNVLSGACGVDSPDEFRRRFTRRCDEINCWYELDQMLLIDTEVLNQGVSSLVGKVSQGNYNYRTKDVALNLIGSGVQDCSRAAPSCHGSAYVEYELAHNAFNVPLEDYLGETRCFNFGRGQINSGKALAAERFLTVPLGSADAALVNQPAFLKTELAGRPLAGAYRLRIKDAPGLEWQSVEDIQLFFNYRYWSRVDRGL